jgi:hypothetical protein
MNETKIINESISEKNNIIKLYNIKVLDAYDKIKLLKWNDYIELDEYKYGIPECYDEIHRKDDCGGLIMSEFIFNNNGDPPIPLSRICNKCGKVFDIKINSWIDFAESDYRLIDTRDKLIKRSSKYY